jgi:sugar O-acyltransferase (sialic acid O-acetyltransferase NeuD family)
VIEQTGVYQIAGIVDREEKLGQSVLGYKIIATDLDIPELVKEYKNFFITVGQIKSSENRIRIFQTLKESGVTLPVIISPLAYVSKHANIREGTIIMHHALINAGAKIGSNCIINTKALIEHDAVVGDHCHVATGAIINGGANVGRGTFFGSGAVCREYVEIDENLVIGYGGNITENIP